jgi:hypothetical protein
MKFNTISMHCKLDAKFARKENAFREKNILLTKNFNLVKSELVTIIGRAR